MDTIRQTVGKDRRGTTISSGSESEGERLGRQPYQEADRTGVNLTSFLTDEILTITSLYKIALSSIFSFFFCFCFFFTIQRCRNCRPKTGTHFWEGWAGVASLTIASSRSSAAEEPRIIHLEGAHGQLEAGLVSPP